MILLRLVRTSRTSNYFIKQLHTPLTSAIDLSRKECRPQCLCSVYKIILSSSTESRLLYSTKSGSDLTDKSESTSPVENNVKIPEQSYLEEVLLNKKDNEPKTTAEKMKRSAENTFFYMVGAASIAAVLVIGYKLLELFWSPDSPQSIYTNSLKLIRADDRCIEIFGGAIAAHGEDSGRGRRRYIANMRYTTHDGEERVRIAFHVKGPMKKGRATVEMSKIDGVWRYRFLLVETNDVVPQTILVVDSR